MLDILSLIDSVRKRQTKNKWWADYCLLLVWTSYLSAVFLLLCYLSTIAGLVLLVLGALGLFFFFRKKGAFTPTTDWQAVSFLDSHFNTKDRIAAYLNLKKEASGQKRDERIDLLQRQITRKVSGLDLVSALPFSLTKRVKRLCFSLPVVLCLILFCLYDQSFFGLFGPRNPEAEIIRELLKQESTLPKKLQDDLEKLAVILEEEELDSSEVADALQLAESELEAAEKELEAKEENRAEQAKAEKQIKEEPKPVLEPTPPPEDQEEQKKETADKPTPTPKEQEAQKKQEKTQQKKGKEGKKGGQSKEQKDGKEGDQGKKGGGQKGKQGKGTGKQQSQDKKSQGKDGKGSDGKQQEGQQKQEGKDSKGGKEEKKGAQQKDAASQSSQGSGKQKSKEQNQKADLKKAKQALNKIKESRDKNESSGGKKGAGKDQQKKKEKGDSEKSKKENKDKNKKPGDNQQKGGPPEDRKGDNRKKGAKHSKTSQELGDRNDTDSKSDPTARSEKDGKSKEFKIGNQGKRKIDLGGEEDFEEVKIDSSKEKLNTKFTSKESSVSQGKKGGNYKTNLKDVELAKPDPIKDKSKQPIPLEYRDLLK